MTGKKSPFSTFRRDLYCFADSPDLCRRLLEGGARIIQLREKHLDDPGFHRLGAEMQALVREYPEAVLIVNDRVEIALELGADGIHIGQEDENYREVIRRVPPEMIVGVSVDTAAEAIVAQEAGATYVGAGSVFPTPTKPDAQIIGIEALHRIVQSVHIPVVAIGGIALENAREVVAAGAHYLAVISQINDAADIPARIREFRAAIADPSAAS
ncbi:MAG: thiamine phosphate synthase [Desulfobacterales bacterium]|nr:thiamine phosphate synthase [Desulfobacterales bacterium]